MSNAHNSPWSPSPESWDHIDRAGVYEIRILTGDGKHTSHYRSADESFRVSWKSVCAALRSGRFDPEVQRDYRRHGKAGQNVQFRVLLVLEPGTDMAPMVKYYKDQAPPVLSHWIRAIGPYGQFIEYDGIREAGRCGRNPDTLGRIRAALKSGERTRNGWMYYYMGKVPTKSVQHKARKAKVIEVSTGQVLHVGTTKELIKFLGAEAPSRSAMSQWLNGHNTQPCDQDHRPHPSVAHLAKYRFTWS